MTPCFRGDDDKRCNKSEIGIQHDLVEFRQSRAGGVINSATRRCKSPPDIYSISRLVLAPSSITAGIGEDFGESAAQIFDAVRRHVRRRQPWRAAPRRSVRAARRSRSCRRGALAASLKVGTSGKWRHRRAPNSASGLIESDVRQRRVRGEQTGIDLVANDCERHVAGAAIADDDF